MPKLSDTAALIITNAAARADRKVLPVPGMLRAPAVVVRRTLGFLLREGLLTEVPASPDDAVWQSEEAGPTTLVVTASGLRAVGIEDTIETNAPANSPDMRGTQGKPARKAEKVAGRKPQATSGRSRGNGGQTESKQSVVVTLLRRQQGASIEEMTAATDWQAHSVRGFMSGALKKRLGIELISEKNEEGVRRYYVAPIKTSSEHG